MSIAIIVLWLVGFLITFVAGAWIGYAVGFVLVKYGGLPWSVIAALPMGYAALLVASVAYKKVL